MLKYLVLYHGEDSVPDIKAIILDGKHKRQDTSGATFLKKKNMTICYTEKQNLHFNVLMSFDQ